MSERPHIVIVGAGFGGLAAAQALDGAPLRITVVDRRNHHLCQPLLYQVATAGLSPHQIAAPIRSVLRDQPNVSVVLGEVTGVDLPRREVVLDGGRIPFDHLIIATGARHSYFGNDAWEAYAPGLKTLQDALDIRKRVLLAFERAELSADPAEQRRLLTFAVIGGGPTGVEMAGVMAELSRLALARDFRRINPRQARILLVEAGQRILPAFSERLSAYAAMELGRLGVEVLNGRMVKAVDVECIQVGDERIPAATVVWAAGVTASPAAVWLGAPHDRAGRIATTSELTIEGLPDTVFVIGDTAAVTDPKGGPLPGLAPVAKQQGQYVAKVIRARLAGKPHPGPFRYRDYGHLATIGRGAAVIDFKRVRLTGFTAWVLWTLAHIYYLIGFRNRLGVFVDWLWSYVTLQRGARLIPEERPMTPDNRIPALAA